MITNNETNESNMALFLRTCDNNMKAYGGFQWPKEVGAVVTAPDWEPTNECGKGLHGLLNGTHDSTMLSWEGYSIWMVVEADLDKAIDLDGKHKFESCTIKCIGTRKEATDFLITHGCIGVHGAYHITGYKGTSTSGDLGTSISGYMGNSTSRFKGTSISERFGTSISGDYGTSTSGNYGTSISEMFGTSKSGDFGTSTSEFKGMCSSGEKGIIHINYWDSNNQRNLFKTGYIGIDGLEPNVLYKLDKNNNFIKA